MQVLLTSLTQNSIGTANHPNFFFQKFSFFFYLSKFKLGILSLTRLYFYKFTTDSVVIKRTNIRKLWNGMTSLVKIWLYILDHIKTHSHKSEFWAFIEHTNIHLYAKCSFFISCVNSRLVRTTLELAITIHSWSLPT